MHILIVDDMPEFKVLKAIQYLESKNLDFTYEITKSVHSAGRYLSANLDKIDLVIVDLGLPWFENGDRYEKLNGLVVVTRILRYKPSVPVIINSTTEIPDEEDFLEPFIKKNAVVKHVESLDGKWLIEFINQM